MTLKTDFVDGDILHVGVITDSDKLNGITNQINENTTNKSVIHYKTVSSATEETTTNTTWTDTAATFTITHPANSYLIGINLNCELKTSSGKLTRATVKIVGTTLGTKYIDGTIYSYYYSGNIERRSIISTTTQYWILLYDKNYIPFTNFFNPMLKLTDTSTTFTVVFNTSGSTGYIRNIKLEIMYATPVIED